MAPLKLMTVYRSAAFERYAPELLGLEGTEEFVDFIAANPLAGDVVAGTGGVRKVRWGRSGKGKRGGVRILYYYHDDDDPIGLLTIYAKGDKDSLTKEEKAEFRKLTATIKQQIRDKHHHRTETTATATATAIAHTFTQTLPQDTHHAPQHRQRGT
jgi:hypothetical protein